MSEETEIWGELSQPEFNSALQRFSQTFGQPRQSRRLALQADHFKRHDLDTRIRLTDGQAELVQKVGRWKATTRQEMRIPLRLSARGTFNLYQLLINQLPPDHRQTNIIQYKNYIFDQPRFELKLGEQTGKQTVYHYEVEASHAGVDLEDLRAQLNLPPSLKQSDETFWSAWNERVNLNFFDLTEDELTKLIEQYL